MICAGRPPNRPCDFLSASLKASAASWPSTPLDPENVLTNPILIGAWAWAPNDAADAIANPRRSRRIARPVFRRCQRGPRHKGSCPDRAGHQLRDNPFGFNLDGCEPMITAAAAQILLGGPEGGHSGRIAPLLVPAIPMPSRPGISPLRGQP